MLRRFEYSRVYRPGREMTASAGELGRAFEDVFFPTADGARLNGWYFPADATGARVILFAHGNAGNISHRLEFYRALLEAGAGVFAFDYRGYGRSEGRLGEEATYRDAQAAHQWLRQKGFNGRKIVAYGESLGGGVAAELCLREETAGLILQSTFTSLPDIGAELYPWLPVRWMHSIKYDTRGKLPRLKIPVLVMHSRGDGFIGFHHGERLFAAANAPKQFCEIRGTHGDPLEDRARFITGVAEFLRLLDSAG